MAGQEGSALKGFVELAQLGDIVIIVDTDRHTATEVRIPEEEQQRTRCGIEQVGNRIVQS
jgi:hypothetical protein